MNKWKKIAALLLAAVVLAGTIKTMPAKAAEGTAKIELSVPNNKVPTFQYQKAQDFVINVTNKGDLAVTNLVVEPELQGTKEEWPFKTDYQNYSATIPSLDAGKTAQVKFNFMQRDDAQTERYTLNFTYNGDSGVTGSKSFYVNTTAKPETTGEKDSSKEDASPMALSADAGGFSTGEASYSDGGGATGSGNGSVPRVIVTGFTTDPGEVKAGTDFTLTIHLKNTSKSSKVGNMLFDLNAPVEGADEQTTAPAFLPSSGSSSIFLDGIPANGTADISIRLNAKADLLQKPYSVEMSMKYEDKNYNAVEASSSLSIPVKQDARFEFSDFEVSPDSIAVGEEANAMCSLYNLGRIKLYNVKAVFEGACIEKEEVFVGNVESGATASIDAMLEGKKETQGPAKIKMTLSYENEEGEVTTAEKELTLEVTEEAEEDVEMSADMEEEGRGFPVVPVVIAVIVVIAGVVIFVLKRRKKKKMINEEEELLYELDGPSEDEQQ